MSNFVRRIVSGNKARFKDSDLKLELDLVYLTDSIIIMGYPASSFEGLYRNRREDAKKFLDTRHGNDYWVFNFCPWKENSYDPSVFEGRVSRYPFPDHHAPPLAILPLAVREMQIWLAGSPNRVVVLHCKAGKGRSGTLACALLLSLDAVPTPPKLERSYTKHEWNRLKASQVIDAVEERVEVLEEAKQRRAGATSSALGPLDSVAQKDLEEFRDASEWTKVEAMKEDLPPTAAPIPEQIRHPLIVGDIPARATRTPPLDDVLSLHTQRRMKPSTGGKKSPQGVSIPSQRRFLHYWSQILNDTAPPGFWSLPVPLDDALPAVPKKVVIQKMKIRIVEPKGTRFRVVKAVNTVLERTGQGKVPVTGAGDLWVSLASYDEQFVKTLERWEKHTRQTHHFGQRKEGSDSLDGAQIQDLFSDGKWDKGKMVQSFAKLGLADQAVKIEENETNAPTLSYELVPLTDAEWTVVQKAIEADSGDPSFDMQLEDHASALNAEGDGSGIIVDSTREIRIKLYMGRIFMGWLWFIPAFHMQGGEEATRFKLTRKEIDFPLGPGEWLINVDVQMKWCS
ncbi:phosphatases II [Sistotremastrum niveocremeum HHB9708]|uniref:phosphatidylinositol-3,4,5-trisphosphate 3-phosphatase n=1 Tax=Sistotremastrum niveocremeum HHB9708 TaxID=1314777 RepID=A0A164YUI9_9AGAM|nr:phosphatases II [Sistotremastrum niveocremeum HHB9708]